MANRLFNTKSGSGPAIVFLHYFGGSSRTWELVIDALAPDFRCFAFDLRGWGMSQFPGPFSVDDMADDVLRTIDALSLDAFTLVGHSMGGKVALAVAASAPSALSRLILVAPSPPSAEPMTDKGRQSLADAWNDDAALRKILTEITASKLDAETAENVIDDNKRASKEAWRAWPERGSLEDISNRMTKIDVPVKIILGASDKSITRELVTKEIAEKLPNGAEIVEIENAAHLIPLEQAHALAGEIGKE